MFFILSKILDFLCTPTVWIFILLLLGICFRDAKRRRRFTLAALLVFVFFTNDFIVDEFMRAWEIPAVKDKDMPEKYNVGIVLGGMMGYDPTLNRVQFDRGADRIFQAIRLYKQGVIKKILLDGGSGSIIEKNILEAPLLRRYLLQIGIPDSVILVESHSRNTHENALFVKPILDSIAPHQTYLLITSASHMRRAIKCFTKVGIDVVPYSADRYSGPRKFVFDHIFIPDKHALLAWDVLLHEWIGYITYKIAGYI